MEHININTNASGALMLNLLSPITKTLGENMDRNFRATFDKAGLSEVEISHIPTAFLVPALQGAAICDDEYLRELWANLLRNASKEDNTTKLRSVFVDILRGLSHDDALMLKAFAADENYRPDYSDEQQRISRDNLMRLSVIDNSGGFDGARDRLSSLGAAFLRAVS